MNKKGLEKGDEVEVIGTGFKVKIQGFIQIGDEVMIQTYCGDINIDLVEPIKN